MQAKQLDSLFALLDRQLQLADALLHLLDREQHVLLAADVEGIAAVSREKTRLVEEIGGLDRRLAELLDSADRTDGQTTIDLSSLADRLSDDAAACRLRSYRDRLRAKRGRIRDANAINQRLVSETLAFLNDAVDLLVGGGSGYPVRSGRRPHKGPAFISREV